MSGLPLAVVEPGFYLSNFTDKMTPRKVRPIAPNVGHSLTRRPQQEDGTFVLALPVSSSAIIPVLDTARDYGAYVVEAIESPSFGAGSEVLAASEYISVADLVKTWSAGKLLMKYLAHTSKELIEFLVSGKTITHRDVPDETFVKLVPRGGEELVEMRRYFQEFGCNLFLALGQNFLTRMLIPHLIDFGGKDLAPSQKDLKAPTFTFEAFAKATPWEKILA